MLTDLNQVKTATELIVNDWVLAADDVRQFAALVLNVNLKILNSNKEVIVSSIDNK